MRVLASSLDASAREAAETLEDIARLRRRTRRSLGTPWFPMLFFGGVMALSAPLLASVGDAILLPLWTVAGSAGMPVMRRHYRRRAQRCGVSSYDRRTWLIAWAGFAGCLVAGLAGGALGGLQAALIATIATVLTGYAFLGWVRRSAVAPLAVAPGAALAAVLAAANLPPWTVELSFGAGLMAAGACLLAFERRA